MNRKVEADDIRIVFENLKQTIIENLFESYLPASTAFGLEDAIEDTEYKIPVIVLESAVELFDLITEQYSDYLEQFYSAVANIMNRNYRERTDFPQILDDDDLPF